MSDPPAAPKAGQTPRTRPWAGLGFSALSASLVALAMAACAPRTGRRDGWSGRAGHCRGTPSQAEALAAVMRDAPTLHARQLRAIGWSRAELDGRGAPEAVLTAAVSAEAGAPTGWARLLWAVGCDGDQARVLASYREGPDGAEDGTFDAIEAFAAVRAERVVEETADALWVEFEEAQGGYDPRTLTRHLVLLRLQPGRLEPLFRCALSESTVSGPARAGVTTTRTVHLVGGWPRRIVVRSQRAHDPGALEGAEEIAADAQARGIVPGEGATEEAYALREGRYHPQETR